MKKFILFFYLNLLGSVIAFSQKDHEAYLSGYRYSDYLYFDSLHKVSCNDLSQLNRSYQFYVAFKIDTNAAVVDLEFIEIPVLKTPDLVKAHILQMMRLTDGKWIPQIKGTKKVLSDEIMYMVMLSKRNQSPEDREKDNEKLVEYYFGPEIKYNDKLTKFDFSKHKKYMILSY